MTFDDFVQSCVSDCVNGPEQARSFTVVECEQRSEAWHRVRAGLVTGTCADPMLANPRKGQKESVQRRDLRIAKALEIITEQPQEDGFVSREMQRGREKESAALDAYQIATGRLVYTCGFVKHNTLRIGCSPDGYVGDFEGLVSLKCPKSATHLEYLRERTIPTEYVRQLTHEAFVTEAQWADFVSFDDRMPEPLQLLVIRVTRDQLALKEYELALRIFLKEIDDEVAAIRALQEGVAA